MDSRPHRTLQLINGFDDENKLNSDRNDQPTVASDLELLDAYSRAVISVVETIGPSVVSVSVGPSDASRQPEQSGAGSGVVIAPDGYILTNDHVIDRAGSILVRLTDGTSLSANLVGKDPASDLAVIRADTAYLATAVLGDSDRLNSVVPTAMRVIETLASSKQTATSVPARRGR